MNLKSICLDAASRGVTPELINQQIDLEREAIRCGNLRLDENTKKLEDKDYASASVYGTPCIAALIPVLVEEIKRTRLRIERGKNGRALADIAKYVADLEPEALAAIALKITFDCIFSPRIESSRVQYIATSVGKGVESEAQMRCYESHDPELLHRIKRKYWHSSIGTEQKLSVTRLMMNRHSDVNWQRWPIPSRARIGAWLVDCICTCSGWFVRKQVIHRAKRQVSTLVPSEEFNKIKDQLIADARLFAPLAWPMIVEPNPWGNKRRGGYLLNELMHGHSLVRGLVDPTVVVGETPLAMLNRLQNVAYRLNPHTASVGKHFFDQRRSIGSMIALEDHPLPPKPPDIETNEEARHSYCRAAAEVMNLNAQMYRKSVRTRYTIELVDRFTGVDRWYLPWSFDYRGRVYPIPVFLGPQNTDFGKSLLRFADEVPVTERAKHWLAFQVATTYGLDKSTIEERIQWVAENHPLIRRVAADPIGNQADWEAADEPWQFLAACEEYVACVIDCTRQTTGLPVAVDATCSGLQILSGLALDGATAALVNVQPGDTPNDAYRAVAEAARPRLEPRLADLLDRKVTKRTVMTIPYNAKPWSNRQYIRDALREKEAEFSSQDLEAITKAVIAAMKEVTPGPLAVMNWINVEVAEALKRGVEVIEWTTPSGFGVRQRLMKPEIVRVELQLLGSCNLKIQSGETDEIDKKRHKAATAPNLIHSLDASLLHLAFKEFSEPFSVIHDSILCRATDMDALNKLVRTTYCEMFSGESFLRTFAEAIGATSDPPIIGDFDPADVLNSTYFFC